MGIVLASSWLASLGQIAAIILAIYLFLSIILGLALTAVLMFGLAWVREKIELIKKLLPFFAELNRSLDAASHDEPLPEEADDNRLIQAVSQIPRVAIKLPATTGNIEQKIEQGSDRLASGVIELRARTQMVKGIVRAFFLPQTMPSRRTKLVEQPPAVEQEPAVVSTETVGEPPIYEEEIVIVQSSR